MKSKTSFFNKTIFIKNMTLYAPVWIMYLLYLCAMVPGRMWKNFRVMSHWTVTDWEYSNDLYRTLSDILGSGYLVFGALLLAGFSAMALYHYLYVAKNANMIHSLPVTRLELYVTNIISGLTFAIVPQVIATILAELVCIRFGHHLEKELFMWMIYGIGINVIFQAMATLCAMMTGLLLIAPMLFALSNVLVLGLAALFEAILTGNAYGVDFNNLDISQNALIAWMTPVAKIVDEVGFHYRTNSDGMIISRLETYGGKVLVGYLVIAVILYLISWFAYKKRSLECAGDLVAFSFLKPIFRWGVGFCGGYVCAMIIEAVIVETGDQWSFVRFLVLDIVLSMLFYFVAEMLIQKKVKIFNKTCVRPLIAFGVFMVVSYGAFAATSSYLEHKLPNADKVERAYIYMDYRMEMTGEEIPEVIDIQKQIIANKKAFTNYLYGNEAGYISISYVMKDGKIMQRQYHYPLDDKRYAFEEKILEMQQEPEKMAMDLLGYNYEEQLTPTKFWVEAMEDVAYAEDEEIAEESSVLPLGMKLPIKSYDLETVEKIYQALLKDIKEGNVHQLRFSSFGDYEEYGSFKEMYEMYSERARLVMGFAVKDIRNYQSIDMRARNENYYQGEGNYNWTDSNLIDIHEETDIDGTNIEKEFVITDKCVNVLKVLTEIEGQ